MRRIKKGFGVWTLGLAVLFGVTGLAVPPTSIAVPNTGGTQKTEKQCKNDLAKCNKDCDQLIDIDNNIKRCKDLCTDSYLICLPLRSSGQPGSKLGGVRPSVLPSEGAGMSPPPISSPTPKAGMKKPIMRRGIEGELPASSEKEGN